MEAAAAHAAKAAAAETAAPGTAPEGAATHAAKAAARRPGATGAAVEAARRGRRRAVPSAPSTGRPRPTEAPQPTAGAGKNIGHRPDNDDEQHNADHKGQDVVRVLPPLLCPP